MNTYAKEIIKINEDNKVCINHSGEGVFINDYLEIAEFHHYQQDYYTEEDLINISLLLKSANNIKKSHAAISVASFLSNYFAAPTLYEEPLWESITKLLFLWRLGYKYNNSLSTINEFERQIKGRVKEALLYNDIIIIDIDNSQLLDDAMSASNCKGELASNIKIVVSENEVNLTCDNNHSTLYYYYEKTKKK